MELPDLEALTVPELLALHASGDEEIKAIRAQQAKVHNMVAIREREAERPGPAHLLQVTKPYGEH